MATWTDEKLEHLANAWMRDIAEDVDGDAAGAVVLMNFTVKPDQQWRFIELAVAAASSDDQFEPVRLNTCWASTAKPTLNMSLRRALRTKSSDARSRASGSTA